MQTYKSERDWKDLARADKVVLFSGFLLWALFSYGIYNEVTSKYSSLKGNVVKTEMVRGR